MKNIEITDILESANIRPTPARILVLRAIMESDRPLSSLEIEKVLDTVDRSSITRTLSLFVEVGIVKDFADGSGSRRYELHIIDNNNYPIPHAHFHCRKCGETTCLKDILITNFDLPDNFVVESSTFVISGLCPKCK